MFFLIINLFLIINYKIVLHSFLSKHLITVSDCLHTIKIVLKCIRVSLSAFDTDLRYVAPVGVVHRGWFYK